MADAFTDAVDELEQISDARPFDAWAVRSAFYDVQKTIGPTPDVAALVRMFDACMFGLGLGREPRPEIADEGHLRSLEWAIQACFDSVLFDQSNSSRDYVQRSVTRQLGIGRPLSEGGPTAPLPLMHIAVPLERAKVMVAPYLNHLEALLDKDPYAHVGLCWKVFENPVPPFHSVFDQWLADLDARRGTCDQSMIRRAMALVTLAEEGRQRLSWSHCETYLIPQLMDPQPLVAAAAARYLGMLYGEAEEMFAFSQPQPIAMMLEQIAKLPANRRVVAGGFLNGYDCLGPFAALRENASLVGFDFEGWVLDVLDQRGAEPYLPSAQSFWFYMHEEFCFKPAFIDRMIDASHHWEALMTATEMQERVEGMQPVLVRLAACAEPSIAKSALICLEQHYGVRE
jgi:hypothetical protein